MNVTSASLQIAQELLAQKRNDLNVSTAKLQLSDKKLKAPQKTPA